MIKICSKNFKILVHFHRCVVGCYTMYCGVWLTVWQELTAWMFRVTLEGTGRTWPTDLMTLHFETWLGRDVKWLDITQVKLSPNPMI